MAETTELSDAVQATRKYEIKDMPGHTYVAASGIYVSQKGRTKRVGYESQIKGCHLDMGYFPKRDRSVYYNNKWITIRQAAALIKKEHGLKSK